MGKGRHSAGHGAAHRRTTTGSRKAPPEARRASPARVGGARVAGRRVAGGDGRPVVLTALGSGEKLFALVPLAILSVASVVGLAASGDGDPAPADPGTAAGPVGPQTAPPSQVPARVTPTAARPAMTETTAPVVIGEDTPPEAVEEQRAPVEQPTATRPPVEHPVDPADRPAEAEPTTPAPTGSPTATPEPAEDDVLTRAEATARCLASGISTVDVLALGACVDDLLG